MKRLQLRWLAGPLVALATLLMMFLAGEIYFRYFVIKSDSYDFTLMAKRWKEICWKPTFTVTSDQMPNGKIDYRDRTWTDADVQGKTKIMIIGDSFVAGHGLCNVQDRFSDVLQRKLGDKYAVFNVGVNGWGTPEETFYPLLYPYKPDIVVLSYFVNDINNAIKLTKHDVPSPPPPPDWLSQTPLKDSYLIDYVYWQIIYKRQFAERNAQIWQVHLDAFSMPEVWDEHKSEILQVIDWSKKINAPLVVITWPMLDNIEGSAGQIQKVEAMLKENNIPIVSASDLFRSDKTESIVVNNIDSHPNENAHSRMADALYTALQPYLK
jgi:lysophospholipase L1-like esterase